VRFSYIDSMIDPSFYVPLAQAVEEAGYDGFAVPDSVCYPEESDTKYPYNSDGTREFLAGKPFLEPFSLIPALGAVTSDLEFSTFVVKLPIRSPVLVAKQASSVAVLTGGRFALGVGTSPWPEDYAVCGVPWENRGRRMDECIEIVRGLTSPGPFAYKGEFYEFPPVTMTPTPPAPMPILVGGHSEMALRRAARHGDGWMFAGADGPRLTALLTRLAELRDEEGTADRPFRIFASSLDAYAPDGVARLADLGITDVIVGFRDAYTAGPDTETLDAKIQTMRWYAENVIRPVRAG
jgi:probable F420-dependent oxidoreductase